MLSIAPRLIRASPASAIIINFTSFDLQRTGSGSKGIPQIQVRKFEHLRKSRHFSCTHNLRDGRGEKTSVMRCKSRIRVDHVSFFDVGHF